MSAYTLKQLREVAPAKYKDLDDEGLVREYARINRVPFEQAADYYGVRARGTLGEMRRQFTGGGAVDLPRMVGQGLKATGIAPDVGQGLVTRADERAYMYEPDQRPERGLFGQAMTLGARGVAPMLPAIAAGFVPGGQFAAPAVAATLFGTSGYQDTLETLREAGVPEEEARAGALRAGAIQGPLEGVATYGLMRTARPVAAALRGRPTTAGVAQAATETGVLRPFVRGQAVNVPLQAGTEVAQDVGTELIERAYGAPYGLEPQDIGGIAKESALAGAGVSILLSPLGIGGSVSRSRRAQQLQQDLYGENVPNENRAAARLEVMALAQQQGVKAEDTEAWLQRQLREEIATAQDVARQEQETVEQFSQFAESEPAFADILYALNDSELADAMSETDRVALFDIAQQLQDTESDLSQEQRDTLVQQSNELLASYYAAQNVVAGEQDLLAKGPALLRPLRIEQRQVGDMTQVQTNFDAESDMYTAPTDVGREVSPTPQPVPGVQGVRTVAPGVFEADPQLQQVETRAGGPVSSDPGVISESAGALPVATAAGLSTPLTDTAEQTRDTSTPQTQQTTTQEQRAPVAAGSVVTVNDQQVTLTAAQATAWNKAQESHDGKVRRARALTNYQERDSALRSAGMQLSATRREITGALTSKERQARDKQQVTEEKTPATDSPQTVSDAIKEDNEIDRILNAIEQEDAKADSEAKKGDQLFAAVTGDKKKPPGKPSLPTQVYAAIRNAIINPKAAVVVRKPRQLAVDSALTNQYKARIKRIADAANKFAAAYEAYTSQNLVRSGEVIKRGQDADAKIAPRVAQLRQKAQDVRSALAELGESVNGNAKDVEAIVRFVKDRAQKEKRGDTKTEKADIKLSKAWTAAKRESFMEDVDLLDVSGEPVRQSRESAARGAVPQLVEAATDGYATFGKGPKQDGLGGILNYIRTVGTPFEKTLAQAIKLATTGKAPIKIKFIKDGKGAFDPKTNTITINETSSKEVALHEALHGALQWYVHSNPTAPQVIALKQSLQRVVNYAGPLPAKAAEVQTLLRNILKGKGAQAELNAVLELISYGNTLNEFRRALQGMESDAPRTFAKFANDVMEAVYNVVRRMLGVNQTVASDVMNSTFQLLEAARVAEQTPAPAGGRLDASVTSTDKQSVGLTPDMPRSDISKDVATSTATELARGVNMPSLAAYQSTPGSSFNLTRTLLESFGFGEKGKTTQAIRDGFSKAADLIRKDFPMAERVLLNLNSTFGLGPAVKEHRNKFQSRQNTGILEMVRLTESIKNDPNVARPLFDYLDGNANALDGRADKASLVLIADNVLLHLQDYINALPMGSRERSLFSNLNFTQYLLHPQSFGQLASKSFGLKALGQMTTTDVRREDSLDGFIELLPFDTGVSTSDALLYQTFQKLPDADGNMSRVPAGFISKDLAEKSPPVDLDIDNTRIWKFDGKKGGKFVFTTRKTAPADIRKLAEDGKTNELSATLLNTMAALSHNYASRRYFEGISELGRAADGKATADTVVFNSIEEINSVFAPVVDGKQTGRVIIASNILNAAGKEADSRRIRDAAQRTGVWVRLPGGKGTAYGDLAGKYVSGPVWSAMMDMHDRSPLFNAQLFQDTMRWFKKAKTIYTPATHANNVLTNYALMLLHGISHKTLRDAAVMMKNFELSPGKMTPQQREIMQAFYRSGAVLGQYTQTEAKQVITDAILQNISPDPGGSMLKRLAELAGFEKEFAKAATKLSNLDTSAVNLYAAEDNVFRLAAFINVAADMQARNDGPKLTEAQLLDAGVTARKMFLDYDIDARYVRAARQSVLPFVSWSYAILPVMGRIAIARPWAMINMMGAIGLMSSMFDGEDDEWRRIGPEELVRERAWWGLGPHNFMRVPFLGSDENPVYWNIGKSIPMMAVFDPAMGESKFGGQSWIPAAINPGGPYMNLIAGVMFGIDPFTGKKLSDETSSNFDTLVDRTKSIYNTMAPGPAQVRFLKNVDDFAAGRQGPTGREPSSLFLARTLGGLSVYQFDKNETYFYNDLEVQRVKREFGMVMSKAKRDEYNKGYPDYESLDRKLDALRDRLEKRIDEIRGED